MNNQMIYGSVCSGIEAATAGWHHLGWKPSFFSEIEPFPRAVLTHHYPTTPLHGDFTTITAGQYQPIDLLVGGTPCQAFSVAGLRKGLDDPRGNLTLAFLGLIDRLRPKWVVWENVPGVLSIDGGKTFGTFLGGLGELGYGFAYRVLDAQWFGVAQRRRRVFVVGYLGDWRPPAAVLFERDSLHGHPAPSRKAGKGTASHATNRARIGIQAGSHWDGEEVHPSITQSHNTGGIGQSNQEIFSQRGSGLVPQEVVGALCADAHPGAYSGQDAYTGRLVPCFSNDPAATICANEAKTYTNEGSVFQLRNVIAEPIAIRTANTSSNGHGFSDETAYTLDRTQGQAIAQPITQFGDVAGALLARHDSSPCADRGSNVVATPIGFGMDGDVMHDNCMETITTPEGAIADTSHAVAVQATDHPVPFGVSEQPDIGHCLRSGASKADKHESTTYIAHPSMAVRRLTPVECERLQGFPDNFTRIPWRNKPARECPDGPRYKALGNSMAVPVMRWIGERIQQFEDLSK
jgi:DNA (cytosine-5)-methyltransferase 1